MPLIANPYETGVYDGTSVGSFGVATSWSDKFHAEINALGPRQHLLCGGLATL
jgi:hypothetical protein